MTTEERERRLHALALRYRSARLDTELRHAHPAAYMERCVEVADELCAVVLDAPER